jgi:hypothetical protein
MLGKDKRFYANNILVSNCVFCDEFAFVPTQIANEFMSAVRPTLGERVRFKNDYCIYS